MKAAKAVALEIKQTGPTKFELECELPMIPKEIVQTLLDEIAEKASVSTADSFLQTKDADFVKFMTQKLNHYKFWNRVLYILCIAVTVYFVFFAR